METSKVDGVVKEKEDIGKKVKAKALDADIVVEAAKGGNVEQAEVDVVTIGEVSGEEKETNDGNEKGDDAEEGERDGGNRESPLQLPALQYSKVGQRMCQCFSSAFLIFCYSSFFLSSYSHF